MSGISRLGNKILDSLGFDAWGNRDVIPNDFNSETVETNQEFQYGAIDASKIKNLSVDTITVSTTGYIKSGKDSFTDSTNAGYYFSADGIYMGASSDATYLKYDIGAGTFTIKAAVDGASTIGGRTASTLASAINASGNFADAQLDTSTKEILGDFTFGASGAIKMITDADNGLWISPTGILGKKAGVTTFAVDTSGNASFRGSIVITGGSGYDNLTDKPTLGNLASEDTVGASDMDTTIIDGGYLVTGMVNASRIDAGTLNADRIATKSITGAKLADGTITPVNIDYLNADDITAGTFTIDPVNSLIEALVVKKGGDIFIEGYNTNPGELIFRDGDDTSKFWRLHMNVDTASEFLYLLPNGLTYKDFFIGNFNNSGSTYTEQTKEMLRHVFINTGNTSNSNGRPSIVFQNWNAYGNKWSRLAIGRSDTESLVEIGGRLEPDIDDTYDLGSSTKGWRNLFLSDGGSIYGYNDKIRFNTSLGMPTGSVITIGLDDYQPITLNYKDHSGVNKQMNVLGKIF